MTLLAFLLQNSLFITLLAFTAIVFSLSNLSTVHIKYKHHINL